LTEDDDLPKSAGEVKRDCMVERNSVSSERLGLIAGAGDFPVEVARGARRAGRQLVVIAFPEWTSPAIEAEAEQVTWLQPGQIEEATQALLAAGISKAVMAGKVSKVELLDQPDLFALDESANGLLRSLPDQCDDSILRKVVEYIEGHGIRLLSQQEIAPKLFAGPGALGRFKSTPEIEADIRFGWSVAKAIAGLDIGQTVVVKDRAVLAVEAIEGTDAAIRRGGGLASGAVVVKVAKPNQDPRFDLPAIGRDTASMLVEARISALAFEAHHTVVLNREQLVEVADEHGIALLGVESDPVSGEIA
jgi:hypothetical protein